MPQPPQLCEADAAASKREILETALQLFVKHGLRETSIRDIAAASGYTNPALYKFFGSKDELALHVFERCYAWLYEGLDVALQEGSFEQKLQAWVEAWVSLAEQSLSALLYVNETLRVFWPKLQPAQRRRSLLRRLRELLAQGQREGSVPAALEASLGVALLLGTLGQVARQLFFEAPKTSARAYAPQLHALLLAALTRSSL